MSNQLRVFISSTMKDLANERDAIARRLEDFNLAPVNAEDWLPNSKGSWEKICDEIETCDLFILILGEKYGWVPPESNLSVTHMEFNKARDLGLPVFIFLKNLNYDSVDKTSDDATKRDAFRQEVRDWGKGYFTSEPFRLAHDLADFVGKAMGLFLSDSYIKSKVRVRFNSIRSSNSFFITEKIESADPEFPVLPEDLIQSVKDKKAVLFAGAGISRSTGLPTATALIERFVQIIQEKDENYSYRSGAFSSIASDAEAAVGRKRVVEAINEIMHPPQDIIYTSAHLAAVKIFDQILTTNFDDLFEDAIKTLSLDFSVINNNIELETLPEKCLVKIHGSADIPDSLLLTDKEILTLEQTHSGLWKAIVNVFRKKSVIVVGTSLQDPSIVRLLNDVGDELSGYYIAPNLWNFTKERFSAWNLRTVRADADIFMKALANQLPR
jgi:hypothetical protein